MRDALLVSFAVRVNGVRGVRVNGLLLTPPTPHHPYLPAHGPAYVTL
jgi:hypothetical protein